MLLAVRRPAEQAVYVNFDVLNVGRNLRELHVDLVLLRTESHNRRATLISLLLKVVDAVSVHRERPNDASEGNHDGDGVAFEEVHKFIVLPRRRSH